MTYGIGSRLERLYWGVIRLNLGKSEKAAGRSELFNMAVELRRAVEIIALMELGWTKRR